jgi:hypothetical protein
VFVERGAAVRRFLLIVAVGFVCCAGRVGRACAGQFRFQDLEHYYLHYYLPPDSNDPAQTQLKNYAVRYIEAHFPLGSSASDAVSALTAAGAKCSVNDDPNDLPGFVCDWSRPDYGLDYFCCQIDWLVGIGTGQDDRKIKNISMNREESGP